MIKVVGHVFTKGISLNGKKMFLKAINQRAVKSMFHPSTTTAITITITICTKSKQTNKHSTWLDPAKGPKTILKKGYTLFKWAGLVYPYMVHHMHRKLKKMFSLFRWFYSNVSVNCLKLEMFFKNSITLYKGILSENNTFFITVDNIW